MFYATINNAQDTCQPLKTIRCKDDKPWMTPDIKELIRQRQHHFHKGNDLLRSKVATEIVSKCRSAKRKHYSKFANNCSNTWKAINDTRKPKSQTAADPVLANQLNDSFYNVWEGIQQPDIFIKPASSDRPALFNDSNVIRSIEKQSGGSCGPDGLSSKLLKSARLELATPIANLFNTCIQHSFVPSQWKSANITPIPKTPRPAEPADYRPIALTSTLCKVFERILAKKILECTAKLWQSNRQYGFLPGHNTMDAIIKVVEDWSRAKDQ